MEVMFDDITIFSVAIGLNDLWPFYQLQKPLCRIVSCLFLPGFLIDTRLRTG